MGLTIPEPTLLNLNIKKEKNSKVTCLTEVFFTNSEIFLCLLPQKSQG